MSNYQYYEYQPGNDDGSGKQDNGYNPYTNQYNGQYQQPQKKQKRPHPKAKFVGKVVAAALIFGVVAGPVTAGTNMLTNHLTGNDQASVSEDNSSNTSNGNKISSTTTSASATNDDVSALASEALLETCAQCHKDTDMAEKVHTLQAEITAREKEVGQELSDLKDKLAEAVAGGEYSEEELDAIRGLHRTAQWFFDYDYVENSEGAHNSTLAKRCLDTAEETIQEAMGLFKS